MYNPKPFKQKAREIIKIDHKQLKKDLAKTMIKLFYFTDRALQIGFNKNLDSHQIDHANNKSNIEPNSPDFGIKFRYFKI